MRAPNERHRAVGRGFHRRQVAAPQPRRRRSLPGIRGGMPVRGRAPGDRQHARIQGWSDHAVEERFGFPMCSRWPRRCTGGCRGSRLEPQVPPDPWGTSRFRPLLHGLLYALPGVCFPAAVGMLTGPGVLAALIVALLVGWSLSQGLAYLGYTRLGGQRSGPEAAGAAEGPGGRAGGGGPRHGAHRPASAPRRPPGAALRPGRGHLHAGRRRAAGARRRGVAAGGAGSRRPGQRRRSWLWAGRPYLEHVTWIGMAATPVLALALAVVYTRRTVPRRPAAVRPARSGWGRCPSAGFGLAAAGLLTFPVAAGPTATAASTMRRCLPRCRSR